MIFPYSLLSVARILVIAFTSCSLLLAEEKKGWEITEIDGGKYVDVEQIQKFYHFKKLTRNEASIRLESDRVLLEAEIGSQECRINGIRVIFSKPVRAQESTAYIGDADLAGLIDPILRPTQFAGVRKFGPVILDPADGGKEPGTTNELGTEGEFTLKIAKLAKAQLEAKGIAVVLTRQGDQDLSPEECINLANAVEGSAIFIGISFNSDPAGVNELQTFPVGRGDDIIESDPFGSVSVALATAVHGSLIRILGKNTSDGGIKRGEPDAVFSRIMHPSIQVSAGSLTDPDNAKLIANESYQAAVAKGIVDGVNKFRNVVGQRKPMAAPAEQ